MAPPLTLSVQKMTDIPWGKPKNMVVTLLFLFSK